MAKKVEVINGVNYEFVKEIPSETRVKGWYVRVDGEHYVVLAAPVPRLYTQLSAYVSNRNGRPNDIGKPLFLVRGEDLQVGVDMLIQYVADKKGVVKTEEVETEK